MLSVVSVSLYRGVGVGVGVEAEEVLRIAPRR